jgi:hypothetical protein
MFFVFYMFQIRGFIFRKTVVYTVMVQYVKIKNQNTDIRTVHYVGLYYIIILQYTAQKKHKYPHTLFSKIRSNIAFNLVFHN